MKNNNPPTRVYGGRFPRIVFWVGLVTILIILASSLWTYREVTHLIRATDETRHSDVAESLAAAAADKLLTKDYGALEDLFRLAMNSSEISSAVITDTEGRSIVALERQDEKQGPRLIFPTQRFDVPKKVDFLEVKAASDKEDWVWQRIAIGVPIGWLRLGYSNTLSHEIQATLSGNVMIVLVVMVILSVVFSTLFLLKHHRATESKQGELIEKERKSSLEVIDSHVAMMEALGHAVAKRDSDTGAHNYRVTYMSIALAEEIGIDRESMQKLIVGSFLHDIGKVGVPDAILLKQGKLTDEEMETMKMHVQHGVDMVKGMGWLNSAHDVVSCHHEKWDGSGYPKGLVGESIPLIARIFAVTDVFDALCSMRPYKAPLPLTEVLEIMVKEAHFHFDPYVLNQFFGIANRLYEEIETKNEASVAAMTNAKVKTYFYNAKPTVVQ